MNIFTCSFALQYLLKNMNIIGMNNKKIITGWSRVTGMASGDISNGLGYWRLCVLVANIYSWMKIVKT